MDESEKLAKDFLVSRGFKGIVHEPDGKNCPDFLVEGRIAVEVRRLNQNELTESGFRGLEQVRIGIEGKLIRLLNSLGPAISGTSWFVRYRLKRPVPQWHLVEASLRRQLEVFRGDETLQRPCRMKPAEGLEVIVFRKATDPHSTFFVYGGGCDADAGGWVLIETQKNLRLCLEEKTRKRNRVRHKYPGCEWWLIFVDLVGCGVDACDRQLFTEQLQIEHDWDKVILLSPIDPTWAFEVPRYSSVGPAG